MAVPFSNTKLRVPKGFQNILECLAREVLRSQPDDIHEFASTYFEKLLKVRSETGHDPSVHGASLEDRNYNNESFKRRNVDPSDPQQNVAATKIQTQYRQHSAKAEVTELKEEMAATRIQAGFRGYLDREQVRDIKKKTDGDSEDTPEAVKEQEGVEEEVDIDLEDPDVEAAAIKIQAGFKGFKARKEVQEKTVASEDQPESSAPAASEEASPPAQPEEQQDTATASSPTAAATTEGEEVIDIDLNDPETEKAALKIQAGFRGYQTRKEVKGAPAEEETAAGDFDAEKSAVQEKEEEIDIDLNDPEVEKAATKIQAGFKGLKTRQQVKQMKEEKTETEGQDAGEDQLDAVPVNPQQEELSEGMAAGEEALGQAEEQSAVEEQAPAEGGEEKIEGEGEKQEEEENKTEEGEEKVEQEEEKKDGVEEEIDIDLEDPEVKNAVVKIQAGFKGMKARQSLKEGKEKEKGVEEGEGEDGEGKFSEENEEIVKDGEGDEEGEKEEESEEKKDDEEDEGESEQKKDEAEGEGDSEEKNEEGDGDSEEKKVEQNEVDDTVVEA